MITKISPGRGTLRFDLREIWSHRELLYFLTRRDISVRYKQTAIGVLWAILQPVIATAVFTLIFSTFARFETDGTPYPLFALSGMMIWLFVHTSVTLASNSFTNNTNLVTKVYFPRLIVPIAAVFAGFFDLFFSFGILVLMMIYYGTAVTVSILLAPVFLLLAVILSSAFGILFSALNVRFRDVKFAVPFFLQIWMIASPLFYPIDLLSEGWQKVFALNPLVGIVEGYRSALLGTPFDLPLIAISVISLMVILLIALFVFNKMEDDFADVI